MDAAMTLVWVAPEPPDAQQRLAMTSWSKARSVTLAEPRDDRPRSIPVDERLADEIEQLLDVARDSVAARDGDAVDRALDTAEARLRAHAELPQAAWLMAEVQRARSTRWRRLAPADVEAADRAWSAAQALDSGRVPGIAEHAAAVSAPAAVLALALPPGEQAWLDGVPSRGESLPTYAGLHALVVVWAGEPVWAGWVDVPPGTSEMRVDAPSSPPCSSSDMAYARMEAAAIVPEKVRCPSWVAVTAGPAPGSIRVATCKMALCGPWLDWPQPPRWTGVFPAEGVKTEARWPPWATWGLAGAGAAIAAGITLVVVNALRPAPTETRFVSGGLIKTP
jgi:hypothetical protein